MKGQRTEFKGKLKASILRSPRQGYVRVITPFVQDFVDSLKEEVPSSHRQWDPIAKHWEISETYLPELSRLLQQYFVEVTTDLRNPPPIREGTDFAVIFQLCSPQNRARLYQSLAFAFHPDRGGSDEIMVRINHAWEASKKGGK